MPQIRSLELVLRRCRQEMEPRIQSLRQAAASEGATNSITEAGAAQVTARDEVTYSALVNCKMHSGSVVSLLEDRRFSTQCTSI